MTFESAFSLPDLPQENNPEIPLKTEREILILKNSIKIELISSMIPPGKDIEDYPREWVDKYDTEFNVIFTDLLKKDPELMNYWEDEKKREDIIAKFQRDLSVKLVK